MNSVLRIVDMTEEKESRDGRNYRTVYFQKQPEGGLLSNAPVRGRNLWDEGPNGSKGDAIYDSMKVGSKVIGDVQSVEVKPYFIPSENGKHTDPETGQPANKATQYSSVVFEGEDIATLARQQGHTIAGQEEFDALEEEQEIEDEELATA